MRIPSFLPRTERLPPSIALTVVRRSCRSLEQFFGRPFVVTQIGCHNWRLTLRLTLPPEIIPKPVGQAVPDSSVASQHHRLLPQPHTLENQQSFSQWLNKACIYPATRYNSVH